MPAALARIIDGEKEAAEIISQANAEADRIKKEAEERAAKVFTEAYEEAISSAEREAAGLRKKVRESAEREAEGILEDADRQRREIEAKASKAFEEAVKAVLSEVSL